MNKKTTKTTTTEPALEQTVEVQPALSAVQKLDKALRAKALSLQQIAIAELWSFVEKPTKGELDPDVRELLAAREILAPPSLLEGALAGQMLNGLVIRSKVRIKPAEMPRTPVVTVNKASGFASQAGEQLEPRDPDLVAERLLKAFGKKK